MPVNSYSFKIAVPTSSIPIITSFSRSIPSPSSIAPSEAVATNTFSPGTPGASLSVPAHSMLCVIYLNGVNYRIQIRCNGTNQSDTITTASLQYYYKSVDIGTSGNYNTGAFYGTDGVLSDTLLLTASDVLLSDAYSTTINISSKCILIDLPE